MRYLLLGLVIFFGTFHWASALPLEDYKENPKEYYAKAIPKKNSAGDSIHSARFSKSMSLADMASRKIFWRKQIGDPTHIKSHRSFYDSEPESHDRVDNLSEKPVVQNIYQLDKMNLQQGNMSYQPWSGDYWPIYRGQLARRYRDYAFPNSYHWMDAFQYVNNNPFFRIFQTGSSDEIQNLSVAEKYDLLTGSKEGYFTQVQWSVGKSYFDEYGKVEPWMGICHGWAAAALMVPRPRKMLVVPSYDGQKSIEFLPSELKGLSSYLWATSYYKARTIGGRCDYRDVERDSNGRPLDIKCLDTNPATWHLAALNLIGIQKQGFIMDATADYEVWNQPVYAYKFSYFNPKTLNTTQNLESAMVKVADFHGDLRSGYRSSLTNAVVGVQMSVQYMAEESANKRKTDDENFDQLITVTYLYDLELDAQGNIIGGEWYQEKHPDFLWRPMTDAHPINYESRFIDQKEWDGRSVLPENWQWITQFASKRGELMSAIVDKLIY